MAGFGSTAAASTHRSAESAGKSGLARRRHGSYLQAMSFWRRISPATAVEDFAREWRQPTPHRWQILGVAVAATFAIAMVFIPESQRVAPARPEVTYISTFAPDRTQEEIIASNLANQKRKDERAALFAEREERRKDMYRQLGRATFIDVDAMEAEIEQERAAEEARAAARAAADGNPPSQRDE